MLLLVIFVLSAFAYVVGRSRAVSLRKNATPLNSLPRYYGYLTAIWAALPGLALLILWSVVEPVVLKASTVNTLPVEIQSLTEGELDLVLNDIKNIATGGISQSADDPVREVAAEHYSDLKSHSQNLKFIVVVLTCLAGALYGLRKVNSATRARRLVERVIMVGLIACSCIAIFTTIGIVLSVLFESLRFFNKVPITDFVFGLHWSPQTSIRADQVGSSGSFGAVPIFAGTLLISAIAMLVAVPFGLMSDRCLRLLCCTDRRTTDSQCRRINWPKCRLRKRARRRTSDGHNDYTFRVIIV